MSMRNPNGFIRPGYDPLQVADAPTAVTPTAGSEAASVDFTPPSNVGGAAVSEYYAVVNPGNITATSVTPPVAVSGLTNGTEYTTKVWANNSYGPSPYSAESSGFTPVPPNVEDVFSTYLYTGNGSARSINNGIDLDGEGGLVWIKSRSNSVSHAIFDTSRGAGHLLQSNNAAAEYYTADTQKTLTAFNSNGFSLGTDSGNWGANFNNYTYASWSFRKSPNFFDVVTWTGNDAIGRQIPHSLGSVPGCIIVKATSRTSNWAVYHRSIGNNSSLFLNNTDATTTPVVYWNSTNPTSTEFTIGDGGQVNENGQTYVAYLFAHDAGGFGDDGLQNVISCGSFTTNGSGDGSVTLGYEPQWLMVKDSLATDGWRMYDTMRGLTTNGVRDEFLYANAVDAENGGSQVGLNATGFTVALNNSRTYIYIAIRRPMKTPESGTEVFDVQTFNSSTSTVDGVSFALQATNIAFPPDMSLMRTRSQVVDNITSNRLMGYAAQLRTNSTIDQRNESGKSDYQNKVIMQGNYNGTTSTVAWNFKRAPSFMDLVCYTGTGANRTVAHNLGVAPELVIIKSRSNANGWVVGSSLSPNVEDYMWLYLTSAWLSGTFWNNTRPTETEFSVSTQAAVNGSGLNFIAYLFASCPGVSKIGTYAGNGTSQDIDCGFSSGARFVLIKRTDTTDSTGDWYVWDSARGIVAGNDPSLQINNTVAEYTSYDSVDTLSSGFTVNYEGATEINKSGASYIFLAIA